MSEALRRLNDEGMRRFAEYLRAGAHGPAPVDLLSDPETSEPLPLTILPSRSDFPDRFEFGTYLTKLLEQLDPGSVSHDRGLWTALALHWFDFLCPPTPSGARDPDKEYRYILSTDYRHYYRHLVRSPWQLVRDHGENARFLLIAPREPKHPLSVHGEILEQFGGRQQVLRSTSIIAAANRLYLDPDTGRPRTGAAGSNRGSARRFGMVLRQLDLTYDPAVMREIDFIELLPAEFDRWKTRANSVKRTAAGIAMDAAPRIVV